MLPTHLEDLISEQDMHVKWSCTSLEFPLGFAMSVLSVLGTNNTSQCLCCVLVPLAFNNHVQCAQEQIGTVLGTSRLEVEVRAVVQQDRGACWNAVSLSSGHYHVEAAGIEPTRWVELKDCIRKCADADAVKVLDVLGDSDQDCPNLDGLVCSLHTSDFTHAIRKPGVAREAQ
jgi:hypothetical protein